ncbi:hypothetical protein DB32_000461 [Sandaracinus amylolyticus]|uniref:Uncharacterized protein n=1 Tax=Sandaracinus amylolyticus TaxID=927083 RepID=A0A0F6VZ36_9BACT|nr:hypothetical protein DB32_000461 [Sandaracinus amylolyticus]
MPHEGRRQRGVCVHGNARVDQHDGGRAVASRTERREAEADRYPMQRYRAMPTASFARHSSTSHLNSWSLCKRTSSPGSARPRAAATRSARVEHALHRPTSPMLQRRCRVQKR